MSLPPVAMIRRFTPSINHGWVLAAGKASRHENSKDVVAFVGMKMQTKPVAASLIIAGVLAGCSVSETPYIDTCKHISGYVVGHAVGEAAEVSKGAQGGVLRVDVAFRSPNGEPQQTTCYFDPLPGEGQDGYQGNPSKMDWNGRLVAESTLVKASLANMKKLSVEGFRESKENLKAISEEAQRRGKNVIEAAKGN